MLGWGESLPTVILPTQAFCLSENQRVEALFPWSQSNKETTSWSLSNPLKPHFQNSANTKQCGVITWCYTETCTLKELISTTIAIIYQM